MENILQIKEAFCTELYKHKIDHINHHIITKIQNNEIPEMPMDKITSADSDMKNYSLAEDNKIVIESHRGSHTLFNSCLLNGWEP